MSGFSGRDILRLVKGISMKNKVYISVFENEQRIADYAKVLSEKFDYEIVSSGVTLEFLNKNGVNASNIDELIPADGFSKKTSIEDFVRDRLDMVIVMLQPVGDIAEKTDDIRQFTEALNIADFSILRAGAKYFENTIVVTDIKDFYGSINVNSYDRQMLALKAFQYLSDYDGAVSEKIGVYSGEDERKLFSWSKLYDLKYGSNPHQKASLYKSDVMADYIILNEKELSHNDILNITTAVSLVSEFYDVNAAAIVKHNLPCGVALGRSIFEAYTKAFDCDPFATFSGTIAFSQTVNFEVAKHLNSMSVKVVVAPYYDDDALELLRKNEELKIVRITTSLKDYKHYVTEEITVTPFGTLVQEANKSELDKDLFKVVTKTKPTTEQLEDAIFAWKVAKYARTNSVLIAKDFKTSAIIQGQTNLVSAAELALDVACENSKDAVMAFDEAVENEDCINAAAQGRISLIIEPGGSVNDEEVFQAADRFGIVVVVTGIRNLKF